MSGSSRIHRVYGQHSQASKRHSSSQHSRWQAPLPESDPPRVSSFRPEPSTRQDVKLPTAASAPQVIAFVCVLVWLINYHHFLTWRWRGFKKLADPFFVPDPSTIHVDLGPMVSWLEAQENYAA